MWENAAHFLDATVHGTVITAAHRIMVLLLIVGMGTEHMELLLPDNASPFCLLSLP